MKDQKINLDPHRPAKCAMWLYGGEYSKQRVGSMDFWDGLSESQKRTCRRMSNDISTTRPETEKEKKDDNKRH